MKKIFLFVSLLFLGVLLVGCSSNSFEKSREIEPKLNSQEIKELEIMESKDFKFAEAYKANKAKEMLFEFRVLLKAPQILKFFDAKLPNGLVVDEKSLVKLDAQLSLFDNLEAIRIDVRAVEILANATYNLGTEKEPNIVKGQLKGNLNGHIVYVTEEKAVYFALKLELDFVSPLVKLDLGVELLPTKLDLQKFAALLPEESPVRKALQTINGFNFADIVKSVSEYAFQKPIVINFLIQQLTGNSEAQIQYKKTKDGKKFVLSHEGIYFVFANDYKFLSFIVTDNNIPILSVNYVKKGKDIVKLPDSTKYNNLLK